MPWVRRGLRARRLASHEGRGRRTKLRARCPALPGRGLHHRFGLVRGGSSQSLTNCFAHVARFYASHLFCETIGAFRIRPRDTTHRVSPQHELIVLRRRLAAIAEKRYFGWNKKGPSSTSTSERAEHTRGTGRNADATRIFNPGIGGQKLKRVEFRSRDLI